MVNKKYIQDVLDVQRAPSIAAVLCNKSIWHHSGAADDDDMPPLSSLMMMGELHAMHAAGADAVSLLLQYNDGRRNIYMEFLHYEMLYIHNLMLLIIFYIHN